MNAYVRHKIAACSGSLIFGQSDCQLHLARPRSLAERILFVLGKQAIRESQGRAENIHIRSVNTDEAWFQVLGCRSTALISSILKRAEEAS
jgi:hypothetical protein